MRRRSGHSDWTSDQAALLVNGSFVLPEITSSADMRSTVDSSSRFTKAQILQVGSVHVGALQLAKSEGTLADPARCRTDA